MKRIEWMRTKQTEIKKNNSTATTTTRKQEHETSKQNRIQHRVKRMRSICVLDDMPRNRIRHSELKKNTPNYKILTHMHICLNNNNNNSRKHTFRFHHVFLFFFWISIFSFVFILLVIQLQLIKLPMNIQLRIDGMPFKHPVHEATVARNWSGLIFPLDAAARATS